MQKFVEVLYFDSKSEDMAFQLINAREDGEIKLLYHYLDDSYKYIVNSSLLKKFDENCIDYFHTPLKRGIGNLYLKVKKLIANKEYFELK